MLFDTHTHLNFFEFKDNYEEVINDAKKAGVANLVVVGTNVENSKKAAEIAQDFKGVYAAVGIHPHHIFEHVSSVIPAKAGIQILNRVENDIIKIERLIKEPKIVAVGETGIDRHHYTKTKHPNYEVNEHFIELQRKSFIGQIKLALKYKKSLIIHNREAVDDLLEVLADVHLGGVHGIRAVFHMCEPDERLLSFAKAHNIFIGIGGDVTYDSIKQEFVKKIPLDLLVLETDSPFLVPSGFKFPNTPANLVAVLDFLAKILNKDKKTLADKTFQNSKMLFRI